MAEKIKAPKKSWRKMRNWDADKAASFYIGRMKFGCVFNDGGSKPKSEDVWVAFAHDEKRYGGWFGHFKTMELAKQFVESKWE